MPTALTKSRRDTDSQIAQSAAFIFRSLTSAMEVDLLRRGFGIGEGGLRTINQRKEGRRMFLK